VGSLAVSGGDGGLKAAMPSRALQILTNERVLSRVLYPKGHLLEGSRALMVMRGLSEEDPLEKVL